MLEQKQIDIIKRTFSGCNFNSNSIFQILKKNPDVKMVLQQQFNTNTKQYGSVGKLVIMICKDIQFSKCVNCGKQLTYDRTISGSMFCSNKCKLAKQFNPLHTQKRPHWHDFDVQKQNAIKQKKKKTCLRKYGVQNYSLLNMFQKLKTQFEDFVQPLFTQQDYVGYDHEYQWKCKQCSTVFKHNIHSTHINDQLKRLPRCPNCYPPTKSSKQGQLIQFIRSIHKGQILLNNRSVIKPMQLDIVLPDLKIAIQFNGTYWHSSLVRKDSNYHINKTQACQKIGYRLIHVFERQWKTKKSIIKQKLRSIITNNQDSVYGRNCVVKQVSVKQKNQFLNYHHIQGEDKSLVKLGLFSNDQLVAVMTFCKPRFSTNYQWQLSRYATSKRVVGGAGKLLKYFQRNFKPQSIVTYADRRYSVGNLYYKLGFELLSKSKPNYFYVKSDSTTILTRYQTQKHKLKTLLGQGFDQTNSQRQNMMNNGWYQIFDCGNLVFVKQY